MLSNRCNFCQHSDICKYKENYEKVVGEIIVKVPEPFTLTLSCAYYSSTAVTLGSLNDYTHTTNSQASGTDGMEPLRPVGADTFVY